MKQEIPPKRKWWCSCRLTAIVASLVLIMHLLLPMADYRRWVELPDYRTRSLQIDALYGIFGLLMAVGAVISPRRLAGILLSVGGIVLFVRFNFPDNPAILLNSVAGGSGFWVAVLLLLLGITFRARRLTGSQLAAPVAAVACIAFGIYIALEIVTRSAILPGDTLWGSIQRGVTWKCRNFLTNQVDATAVVAVVASSIVFISACLVSLIGSVNRWRHWSLIGEVLTKATVIIPMLTAIVGGIDMYFGHYLSLYTAACLPGDALLKVIFFLMAVDGLAELAIWSANRMRSDPKALP